jgi:V/A-type H+/Na+-transporting ATPase subunit A
VREDFLQQSAYHDVDRFCPLDKAYWMLKALMTFHQKTMAAVGQGLLVERLSGLPVVEELARMKEIPAARAVAEIEAILGRVGVAFEELGVM